MCIRDSPETHIDMMDISQFSTVDIFLDEIDTVIKPVNYADIEDFPCLVLNFLHFQSFCISSGSRFFTKYMLTCSKRVNGNHRMHVVGGTNGHCNYFRIF